MTLIFTYRFSFFFLASQSQQAVRKWFCHLLVLFSLPLQTLHGQQSTCLLQIQTPRPLLHFEMWVRQIFVWKSWTSERQDTRKYLKGYPCIIYFGALLYLHCTHPGRYHHIYNSIWENPYQLEYVFNGIQRGRFGFWSWTFETAVSQNIWRCPKFVQQDYNFVQDVEKPPDILETPPTNVGALNQEVFPCQIIKQNCNPCMQTKPSTEHLVCSDKNICHTTRLNASRNWNSITTCQKQFSFDCAYLIAQI